MMRLLLCSILISLLSTAAYSQKFVSQDNRWIITDHWKNTAGGITIVHNFYWFKNAVEINQQSYLELYTARIGSTDIQSMGHFYRENDEGKVYIYNFQTEEDQLAYDFNWGLSDTLLFSFGVVPLPVESIDTLSFLDGSQRRVLEFNSGHLRLIEGIGFNVYPFKLGFIFDYSEILSCFYINRELIYAANLDFFDCTEFFNSTLVMDSFEEIEIWTSDSRIHVSGLDSEDVVLTLYSMSGQRHMETKLVNSSSVRLDRAIPSGMVICQLTQNGQQIHSQKLIIE